jgi:hypothetical protein
VKRLLLLLLLAPTLLPAQDRIGTRLNWSTVEVLLYPSRSLGMQLSLATTRRGGPRPTRRLSGGFHPDSVFDWIDHAARILEPSAPPSGPDVVLLSPVLRSACGDSIRLMRRPNGGQWDRRIALLVDEAGTAGEHFDVLTGPPEIGALLAGLQREAGLSGYDADTVARALADRSPGDSIPVDDIPAVLSPGPMRYPDRSKGGKIIFTFIVGADGVADTSSIRPIYSDHAVFVEWVKPLIAGTRFTPGRLRGQPVAVLVQQTVNYMP